MKKGDIVQLLDDYQNDKIIPWRNGQGQEHYTNSYPAGSIGTVQAVKKEGVRVHFPGNFRTAYDIPLSALWEYPTRVDGLMAAYRHEFTIAQRNLVAHQALWDRDETEGKNASWHKRPESARINWDEDWDGLLMKRVQALASIPGIEVTRIYRKQKLCFKLNGMKYTDFVHLLAYVYGNEDFPDGVRFKPQAYIWWGTLKAYWH